MVCFKVTRHLCFKNSKNLRPQDILAFNSAYTFYIYGPLYREAFCRILKNWITSLNVQKLQIFAILEHRCLVTLMQLLFYYYAISLYYDISQDSSLCQLWQESRPHSHFMYFLGECIMHPSHPDITFNDCRLMI